MGAGEEALMSYEAGCEPHADNFGGSALFHIVDGKYVLSRFYPGEVYTDCVAVPMLGSRRDVPYCFSSYMGQGDFSQSFGPVDLRSGASPSGNPWFEAENLDGIATPVISCDPQPPLIHHFIDILPDQSQPGFVLEASVLDQKKAAEACDRFHRNIFSKEEQELRDESSVLAGMAFVRPEEREYRKALIHFSGPHHDPQILFTSEAAPAEPRK